MGALNNHQYAEEDGEIIEPSRPSGRRLAHSALLARTIAVEKETPRPPTCNSKRRRSPEKVYVPGDRPRSSTLDSKATKVGDKRATVNTGAANEVTADEEDIDIDALLRDNDDEDERFLEERRKRRREILLKFENSDAHDPDSHIRSSKPDASVAEDSGFLLEKTNAKAAPNSEGLSAADYNPDRDSNEDDVRHRIAAKQTAAAAKRDIPAKDDSDDDFDMFADDDAVDTSSNVPKSGAISAAVTTAMADNWDDADGYYQIIIGEKLDGRYLVQSFLGQGVFSSVVKALDIENDNKPVAIKLIRSNEIMQQAGIKEQQILERLHETDKTGRSHVVRLLGSFMHRNHLCLCFELLGMNLREVVRKFGRDSGLSLQAVRVYGMQLMLALDHLRKNRVLHGDLKPDNCFVSEQRSVAKLGDLGSACDVEENEITPYLVSRFYRAPEIILGMPYDYAIDMWSLGVTLFELYTGRIMFPGRNNNEMLRLMMEARGHFSSRVLRRGQLWQQHFEDNGGSMMDFVSRSTDKVSNRTTTQRMAFTKPTKDIKSRVLSATPSDSTAEEIQTALRFAQLLDRCLELSPEKRITPDEALQHPFFATPKIK
ncbi:U4/U6 small nuclear ribonucleoprotein prp4 [Linderina pennispora]|nr:U4/U6 small nuclear ribonucleoprotein prp4 [Linderina pennispora]